MSKTKYVSQSSTMYHTIKVQRTDTRLAGMMKMKTHLGHKPLQSVGTRLWHPTMTASFLGVRHGVTVIDPSVTLKATVEGLYFASLILRNKGRLLLVDSRREFSPLSHVATTYAASMQPSIAISGNRWIGGTLTNWVSISSHVSYFGHIASMFQDVVQRFRVTSPRYKKMKDAFPGFLVISTPNQLQGVYSGGQRSAKPYLKFHQRPDLLIVCRPHENTLLLREAFRLQIPVLAFVDSNASLDYITFPIPVNTENHEWMYYTLNLLSRLSHHCRQSNEVYTNPCIAL